MQVKRDGYGYWNGREGRVWDVYVGSEALREAVGDLLVNVRELNDRVDKLEAENEGLREELRRVLQELRPWG